MQRGRAGGVHDEDRRRAGLLAEAPEADILLADSDGRAVRLLTPAHRLPRGGVAQRLHQRQPRARAQGTGARSDGATALRGVAPGAGLALRRLALPRGLAQLQRLQQAGRECGLGRRDQHLLQFLRVGAAVRLLRPVLAIIGRRRLGRLLLGLLLRRQRRRARRQDKPRGQARILGAHLVPSRQRRGGTGRAERQKRRTEIVNAKRGGGAAHRLRQAVIRLQARQAQTRRLNRARIRRGGTRRRGRQLQQEGEPGAQRGRRHFLRRDPFIQRDQAEPGGELGRQAIALHRNLAAIHHRHDPRSRCGVQAFGHGGHHDPAMGLRQHAALRDGAACGERCGEVEAAEQPAVRHAERQAAPGRARRQPSPQQRQPRIARGPWRRTQDRAAEPGRINRQQQRRLHRLGGGVGRGRRRRVAWARAGGHAGRTSARARSTRVPATASSSGSRRKR